LVALLLAISLTAVPSYAYWSESFEYDDSPLNHGWVQEGPGQPVTSIEQVKSGLRSLRSDAGTGTISCYFPGDVEATSVSAWFYDDGDYCTHCEANVWTRWDGDTQFVGLGKYLDGGNYHVFDNFGTPATAVPVSAGWHLFEWVNASGTIVLYIDGTEVASYTGSMLSSVGIHAGEVGMYVDDIRVYGPSFVSPGRMLFGGCSPVADDSSGPGLFVADPDGHEVVRLLSSSWSMYGGLGQCLREPDWSPEGQRVVLNWDCQLAVLDLYALLPGLQTPHPIHPCGTSPKWSPEGDRIAFSDFSVCLINPDGSGYRSLVPDAGDWGWGAPLLDWTADGLGVVYQSGGLRGDLYLVTDLDDPGGPTVTPLTSTPSMFEINPAISPDGEELAYSEGAAIPEDWDSLEDPLPAAGVRVMDYPGMSTVRALTSDPGCHDNVLTWSPDGQYIYFRRQPSGDPQEELSEGRLWRVRADGSELEELVPGTAE